MTDDSSLSWGLPSPAPRDGDLSPAQFIGSRSVFRVDEVIEWYRSRGRSPEAARKMISWHVARHRFTPIRRGVYVRTGFFDPFLIASRLAADAVVGLISALALRDLTGSPYEATFFTRTVMAPVCFSECIFKPVLTSAYPTFGDIETVARHGQEFRATSLERTFVDCFIHPRHAPEPEELISALARVPRTFDLDACIAMAQHSGSPLAVSRLAFALSCTHFSLTPKQEGALACAALKRPDYFSRTRRSDEDTFVRRWNLIVGPELLQLRVHG